MKIEQGKFNPEGAIPSAARLGNPRDRDIPENHPPLHHPADDMVQPVHIGLNNDARQSHACAILANARKSTVVFCNCARCFCICTNTNIHRAIIDKHNKIPQGTEIGFNPEEDCKRFHVTPGGITVVPKRSFPPPYEECQDFGCDP